MIRLEEIVLDASVMCPKQLLQFLAQLAEKKTGCDAQRIFDILSERERLGSTAIGHGVAIPHGKSCCLEELHGFFVRLQNPIDFDAFDEQEVDLFFMILAPENRSQDHLQALANICRHLRQDHLRAKLRQAKSAEQITDILDAKQRVVAA